MTEEKKTNSKSLRKRLRIWLAALAAAAVGLALLLTLLQVEGYAQGYGHVMARQDSLLRAGRDGLIAELSVASDQKINAGDLILRLDDSPTRLTLVRARHAVAQADGHIRIFEAERKLAASVRKNGPHQSYEAELELEKQKLALLKENLAAAKAELRLAEEQLQSLDVRSPIAGRVVLNPLIVGEAVQANMVLGRVFDESGFTIEAKFPERLLYQLAQGQAAKIKPAGRPGRAGPLTGKVSRVGKLVHPQESGDGYFWVTVSIDKEDARLYPGQDAAVSVGVGRISLFRSILGL